MDVQTTGYLNTVPLKNGEAFFRPVHPNIKRRKRSAVRDFPPGCGRNASENDKKLTKTSEISSSSPKNSDPQKETSTERLTELQNSKSMNFRHSSDTVQENKSNDGVLHEISATITEILPPIHDESCLSNNSKSDVITEGKSLPASPISITEIALKKYPPRRKFAAIRDFPPLFGKISKRTINQKSTQATIPSKDEPHNPILDHPHPFLEKKTTVVTQINEKRDINIVENNNLKTNSENMLKNNIKSVHPGIQEAGKQSNSQDYKGDKVINHMYTGKPHTEKIHKDAMTYKIKSETKTAVGDTKRKLSMITASPSRVHADNTSGRVIVQALMASQFCPWRQGKGLVKAHGGGTPSGPNTGKAKIGLKRKIESNLKVSSKRETYSSDSDEGNNTLLRKSVNLPPITISNSPGQSGARNKVRESLRLFQALCRKFLQEDESKSRSGKNTFRRIDLLSNKIVKDRGKYVNLGKQIVGSVPGVEVGDEYHYRVELNIVGVHRQIQGGIDYLKNGSKLTATSIVASGGYSDELDSSDTLIYSGAGGNAMREREAEDQKLERGNLALKNSIREGNPVRVIRGIKDTKSPDSGDSKSKIVTTYVYDGLYTVIKYWQEVGHHGKLVFKFQLDRIPGQPELAWKEVKKSKKFRVREGCCVEDISQGKELMPICAVNTIDEEKPPPFKYTTRMIYPTWYDRKPAVGCGCVNGCSDSEKCSCAVRNGGEIPFNFNGSIVEAKSLVYECGPSCRCPPSCHNRVSQHGIKFQLEVFKTGSTGWGVRSLNSILSGSFICEYTGELLEDKEAEQRTNNDEYLFDIGHNYNDPALWGGLSSVVQEQHSDSCEGVEDGVGFTIDAAQFGSVGRFINHSCSPNLYAQNVIYDHDDLRMPHIMLFAADNIPPLQELTYHYNYSVDQVRDSFGNIKKKVCHCGSLECTGRMY